MDDRRNDPKNVGQAAIEGNEADNEVIAPENVTQDHPQVLSGHIPDQSAAPPPKKGGIAALYDTGIDMFGSKKNLFMAGLVIALFCLFTWSTGIDLSLFIFIPSLIAAIYLIVKKWRDGERLK